MYVILNIKQNATWGTFDLVVVVVMPFLANRKSQLSGTFDSEFIRSWYSQWAPDWFRSIFSPQCIVPSTLPPTKHPSRAQCDLLHAISSANTIHHMIKLNRTYIHSHTHTHIWLYTRSNERQSKLKERIFLHSVWSKWKTTHEAILESSKTEVNRIRAWEEGNVQHCVLCGVNSGKHFGNSICCMSKYIHIWKER